MARAPASIGHNSGDLPDPKDYRAGLALHVLMDAEKKRMQARHKRLNSKMIEGKGMAVEDIKTMFSMKDSPVQDVRRWLERKAHSLGSMFGVRVQIDLFAVDEERLRAIRFKGMIAGCEGKDPTPPPTFDATEKQSWMEGWHDGLDARKAASEEMQKEFLEGDPDAELDHTPEALAERAKNTAGVGDKAAKDFREDNMPAMPDWAAIGNDHQNWTTEEYRLFSAWFDALPLEADGRPLTPDGLPLGVLNAFKARRDVMYPVDDDGSKLTGGVKPKAADYGKKLGAAMDRLRKRLDLTPADFGPGAGEDVSLENYAGDLDLSTYTEIIVSGFDDKERRRILRDTTLDLAKAELEGEKDDFEAPQSELDKQNARQAVVGAREPPAAEEPAPKPKRESQSAKAQRLAAEAAAGAGTKKKARA